MQNAVDNRQQNPHDQHNYTKQSIKVSDECAKQDVSENNYTSVAAYSHHPDVSLLPLNRLRIGVVRHKHSDSSSVVRSNKHDQEYLDVFIE